jgi:hypothetical protein
MLIQLALKTRADPGGCLRSELASGRETDQHHSGDSGITLCLDGLGKITTAKAGLAVLLAGAT